MRRILHCSTDRGGDCLQFEPDDPRGAAIPPGEREKCEKHFQTDLSDVRLFHAPRLRRAGIQACAAGNAIYWAEPLGPLGLAHELGHIVQQRRAGIRDGGEPLLLLHDARLETEVNARPDVLRDIAAAGYTPAQPIKMRYGWCNYAHILSAMDEAVASLGGGKDPYAGKDRTDRRIVLFRIQSAANWVYLANTKALKAPGRLPCSVSIANGNPVSCATGGAAGGERVFFPGGRDLNYEDVASGATPLFKGNDTAWAQYILRRAVGANNTAPDKNTDWVDALIVLLFGMETARFNSGLCTTLLFLDLIAAEKAFGRTGRKFGFATAFHTGSWEDGEWYGGKYPYATHGTGSGNNYMRGVLATDYQMVLADHYTGLPQRHAVPRREVSLCVHWLESALGPDPDLYDDNLYVKVKNALSGRLQSFYQRNQALPDLKYSPNPTSGVSAFGGAKTVKAKLPGMRGTVWWHDVAYAGSSPAKYYHAKSDPLCGVRTGIAKGPAMIQLEKQNFQSTMEAQGMAPDKAQDKAFSRPDWNATREKSMSSGGWKSCSREDAEWYRYKPCPKCFNI